MNIVDKIYELILQDNTVNTFNNNSDLFQEFYTRFMSIQYNGVKVMKIYEYLLSLNIDEYHETMPYINSKIFGDFNKYEMFLIHSAYDKKMEIDDDYIMSLYDLIETYYKYREYEDQSVLDKLIDENSFIRDYTGAMMVILNSSFFKLSNENIIKMMDSINNNRYLQKVIENGKIKDGLLDRDYIFQYTSRFLLNAKFISDENIENDVLIKAIRESKFKDRTTLELIFKNINVIFLLRVFDADFSILVDVLENSLKDEYDRFLLFRIIYNNTMKKELYRLLVDFIIDDSRYSKYINEDEEKQIIKGFCNNYTSKNTEKEIRYVLSHGANKLFLINLKSDCKDNDWSDDTKKLVYEAVKGIDEYELDFDEAIKVLDALFTKTERVNYYMVLASLKCLIKTYLKGRDIKIYVSDNATLGGASESSNFIQISDRSINRLLITKDYEKNPQPLSIFDTIYHEARHIEQFTDIKNGNIDSFLYEHYKEDLLGNICAGYYKENYVGISFEKDARVWGAYMSLQLLQKHFPYMKNGIKYFMQSFISKLDLEREDKKIFELSEEIDIDDALSKLVSINPSILEEYAVLKREYNFDGTKKIV